jgi:hypothetical protein
VSKDFPDFAKIKSPKGEVVVTTIDTQRQLNDLESQAVRLVTGSEDIFSGTLTFTLGVKDSRPYVAISNGSKDVLVTLPPKDEYEKHLAELRDLEKSDA